MCCSDLLDFFGGGGGEGAMLDVDVGVGVDGDDDVYEVVAWELLSVVVDSIVDDSTSKEDRRR